MRSFITAASLFALVGCSSGSTMDQAEYEESDSAERRVPAEFSVALGLDTPTKDIVLGSTTNTHVSTFALKANTVDVTATRFTLQVDGAFDSVSKLTVTYLKEDGSTKSSSAVVDTEGLAVFTGESLFIPAGTSTNLKVYADTDSTGTPGESFHVNWTNIRFRAADASGLIYGPRTVTNLVEAESFTYHVTKPTVTLSASSPAGATVTGLGEVLRFNIAAAAPGDVNVRSLLFGISTTDVDAIDWNTCDGLLQSEFSLYNLTVDGTAAALDVDADWTLYNADGFPCAAGEDVAYARVDLKEEIGAGETNTFALYVDTTGASGPHNDHIRVDVENLIWDDNGFMKPFDGTLVDNLTVNGGTLVFVP